MGNGKFFLVNLHNKADEPKPMFILKMDWDKINIKSVMKVLRELEKNSIAIDGEPAIVYSDGKEELRISYRKLD